MKYALFTAVNPAGSKSSIRKRFVYGSKFRGSKSSIRSDLCFVRDSLSLTSFNKIIKTSYLRSYQY